MLPERYNVDNIRKVVQNPPLVFREFRTLNQHLWGDAAYILQEWYFKSRYGSGTRVMDEDWDTLVILDACRYDVFSEYNMIPGTLDSRISLGSHSEEFLQNNFGDSTYHDTVYVSANPHIAKLDDDTFHDVIHLIEDWDPEINTIFPADVVEAATKAHRQYPNKRLVVHFMQPHTPYIGPTGAEMRDTIEMSEWFKLYEDSESTAEKEFQEQTDGIKVKAAVKNPTIDITVEDMWAGYRESLEIVLGHVETLLKELDGKSVITADHGEMIGEPTVPGTQKIYTHPRNVYTTQLRKIPWHVVDADGSRRQVTADPPVKSPSLNEETVEERLYALGYRS